MSVRSHNSIDALMQIKNFLIFLKLAVLKVIPISELLNPNRHDGAARFGGRKKLSCVTIALDWLSGYFAQFLNFILNWLRDSLL